jgi:hypothetical protein
MNEEPRVVYGLSSATPKKLSQTEEQLESVNKNLAYLKDRIFLLSERLTKVIKPSVGADCVAKKVEEPQCLVPLADSLRGIADQIKCQTENINSLIDGLEL